MTSRLLSSAARWAIGQGRQQTAGDSGPEVDTSGWRMSAVLAQRRRYKTATILDFTSVGVRMRKTCVSPVKVCYSGN